MITNCTPTLTVSADVGAGVGGEVVGSAVGVCVGRAVGSGLGSVVGHPVVRATSTGAVVFAPSANADPATWPQAQVTAVGE